MLVLLVHFVFCIITHMGESILQNTCSYFSKWLSERFGNNIIIWLHFLFGFKSNMAECFRSETGFRYPVNNYISDCFNRLN